MSNPPSKTQHKWYEDICAFFIGASLISFGVLLLNHTGMVTGGTAGLSLFLHYQFNIPFGVIFFLINLPFYYFAIKRMGWEFALKTFTAVTLVSLVSLIHKEYLNISQLQPVYAAIMGAFLLSTGFIIIFRHKGSLGGFNILALFLQDKVGLRAGWFLMAVDIFIILISLTIIPPFILLLSIVCSSLLNLIIALNYRKDRYLIQ